jgi:hypothetical protein
MSAEHNHAPRCCCPTPKAVNAPAYESCAACPEHGAFAAETAEDRSNRFWKGTALESVETMLAAAATPYTEQETTK